jgi:hypothetical protein
MQGAQKDSLNVVFAVDYETKFLDDVTKNSDHDDTVLGAPYDDPGQNSVDFAWSFAGLGLRRLAALHPAV